MTKSQETRTHWASHQTPTTTQTPTWRGFSVRTWTLIWGLQRSSWRWEWGWPLAWKPTDLKFQGCAKHFKHSRGFRASLSRLRGGQHNQVVHQCWAFTFDSVRRECLFDTRNRSITGIVLIWTVREQEWSWNKSAWLVGEQGLVSGCEMFLAFLPNASGTSFLIPRIESNGLPLKTFLPFPFSSLWVL